MAVKKAVTNSYENVSETQEQMTASIIVQAAQAAAKAVAEAATGAATVLAKETGSTLTSIAILETKMNTLNAQQASFEGEVSKRMDKLDLTFEKIFARLEEIAKGRPTWAVTFALGIMGSICTGLITYIAVSL